MREKRIILTAACAAACLLAVSAFAQIALPPASKAWGFNASLNPPNMPAGEDTRELVLDAAEAAGATHMRLGIHWSAYENESSVADPIPSSFDFPVGQAIGNGHTFRVDADYLAISERGMTPVLIVMDAPPWASTFHKCSDSVYRLLNPNLCPNGYDQSGPILYPALDRMATFKTFVTAVAERYPDAIIEGTNEPELQQAVYERFHPPITTVAEGQCALFAGVRAARVNPQRIVLGAGMYKPDYYTPWLQYVEARGGCYDHFSFHHYGFETGDAQDVRTGPYSNFAYGFQTLRNRLQQYGNGRSFWVTETGISSTAKYGQTGELIGEDLAAHAFKPWISILLAQEDIGGVFVHSISDCPYVGENCSKHPGGVGGLDQSLQVKATGTSEMPRWCWLVLNAGNSYPGCEGFALSPIVPMPPSFYRHPRLSAQPKVGARAEVLFFEDGEPAPAVSIVWQRCNPVGTSCRAVGAGRYYMVPASDRLYTLKAIVTIENPSGTVIESTPLSSIIM
jgi:hypothetical protein